VLSIHAPKQACPALSFRFSGLSFGIPSPDTALIPDLAARWNIQPDQRMRDRFENHGFSATKLTRVFLSRSRSVDILIRLILIK
jgi:hypothetical protein